MDRSVLVLDLEKEDPLVQKFQNHSKLANIIFYDATLFLKSVCKSFCVSRFLEPLPMSLWTHVLCVGMWFGVSGLLLDPVL